MSTKNYCFCGYPEAFIHADSDAGSAKKKHLFWGDTIEKLGEEKGGFLKVYSRDVTGWIKKADTQEKPILDLIFLDVGQGDSCVIVTPEDEKIIVDAGIGNNLLRYLRWRYKSFSTPEMKEMAGKIKSIIITHPDEDHFQGLKYLFEDTLMKTVLNVESIYHNGLFPRKGSGAAALGVPKKVGQTTYLTGLIRDDNDLENFLRNKPLWQRKEFATLIDSIKQNHKAIRFQMLNYGWVGPSQLTASPDLTIRVLGPFVETIDGQPALRYFGDEKMTKNGHSVLLLITYGNMRIFLSGDLNEKAEGYLIGQHGGGGIFQAEILKVAHHGSSSFSDQFMAAVKPYASVISSGDTESYSHPRADTLGLIGKVSRGARPLIFSTELARSTPEYFGGFSSLNKDIEKMKKALSAPDLTVEEKKEMKAKLDKIKDRKLNRIVAVYGAINLRTDGKNALLCQKLEEKNSQGEEWDIYLLEPDAPTGGLKLAFPGK